ncbi:hypothetical protein BSKO_11582 [Bryopsis sp. KO-2023]|nr:hypothetical protein BSKO_11582 [Bryopsis sp. KO-2023]
MSTAATSCSELLERHREIWNDATEHPFLAGCKDGSVKANQFDTWLVQDYLFVLQFTKFVEGLASLAPKDHAEAISGGVAALHDELSWFQAKASERRLSLDASPLETTLQYQKFLADLSAQPYPVQAVGFWAIELVYNQAWGFQASKEYEEFAERWGNADFGKYVKLLEAQADSALKKASQEEKIEADRVFVDIAKLEVKFWNMAFETKQ